jgi:hypothetical protein
MINPQAVKGTDEPSWVQILFQPKGALYQEE